MLKLIIPFFFILLFSCKENNSDSKLIKSPTQPNDFVKIFSAIEKDSSYLISYNFNKQVYQNGTISFSYICNDTQKFIIRCDTANNKFELISNLNDTISLYFESDKFYTVNGSEYKILKLILDKGVTDGEASYFISVDFGLLIIKLNTWREGKILSPEKINNNYLQLTTLLYRVFTEDDFFNKSINESKIIFTPPKVEK